MQLLFLLLACAEPEPKDTRDTADSAGTDSGPMDSGPTGTTPDRTVAEGIWALDGTDPALGTEDLAPLAAMADAADIVALGESIHQTDTYHLLRGRLIPWLVEEHGFRAVALEAPVHPVETTRAWVEADEGTESGAVLGLYFGVWASVAFADTLAWLHDWNLAHPDDRVAFYGIDMQGTEYDVPWLRTTITAVDPDGATAVMDAVAGCWGGTFTVPADFGSGSWEWQVLQGTAEYDEERYTTCISGLDGMDAWYAAHADAVEAALGADADLLTRTSLRSFRLMQDETYYPLSDKRAWDPRDLGMADNFDDLRRERTGDTKTILVAHNAHILRAGELLDPYVYPEGWKNTGSWLADRHGEAYAPILLLTAKAKWTGGGATSVRAEEGSLEASLEAWGPTTLWVDLDAADAAGTVPTAAVPFSNPSPGTGVPVVHGKGAIWVDKTQPMTSYF